MDEDGDEDIVLTEYGTIAINLDSEANVDTDTMILWNRAEQAGHWLTVIPLDNGLPAHGARVTLTEENGTHYQDLFRAGGTGGHAPIRAHFGLGAEDGPVQIAVDWPDGTQTTYGDVSVDQVFRVNKP